MKRRSSGRRDAFGARMTRRHILGVAAGGLLAACGRSNAGPTPTPSPPPAPTPTPVLVVAGYDDPSRWVGRSLTVTSWGGVYEDAQEQAIFEPFQRLTGAQVKVEVSDVTQLREQVEQNQPDWDVCDILGEDVLPLANIGILEPIDYSVLDETGIFADALNEFSVGSSYFSTLLSFRSDAWPEMRDPTGWVDFWDVARYPGPRGLYRDPRTTLEFALLADGVPMQDLYPLDVDRAFASLDRIRTDLTLFWEQGAQAAQSLTSGDLTMVSAWHNRILGIEDEGAAVKLIWNGGALAGDAWVVPRNAPSRDVAMDFINFATRPEVCAAFASLAPFGPVNRGAFDLLPQEVAQNLPTGPTQRPLQFVLDYEWWFKHLDTVQPRFEEWLTEHP